MIKANILVKTSMFNESTREVSDISFKHFMEHETQHEEVVYCFTDSELEQLKREYFEAGHKAWIREEYNRALLQSGLVDAAGRFQTVEETFNSYEASKKDSHE